MEIAEVLGVHLGLVNAYLEKKGDSKKDGNSDEPKMLTGTLKTRLFNFWQSKRTQVIILAAVTVIAYLGCLPNSFVSDDKPLMVSPNLINPLPTIQSDPVVAIINSYTYTLNYLINGTSPLGYHLFNLILHLAVSLIIFFFLYSFVEAKLSFLASLLFAVSPLHSEAVFWVSGRHYILYSLFLLISIIFYLRFTEAKKRIFNYICALLAFVASVYSFPEQAIVLPLFLPLLDFFRGGPKRVLQNLKYYLLFLALTAIFAYLSLGRVETRIVQVSGDAVSSQSHPVNFVITDIIALSTYTKLYLYPIGLSFYHENISTAPLALIFMASAVIFLFFFLPFYFYKVKGNRVLILASGIFLISLLPTLTPLKVSWVVAERYTYLGTLGLALLTACILNLVLNSSRKIQRPLTFALILTILAYGWITFYRGFDWRNEDGLWLATVKAEPTSSKAWNNMGDYYGRHGDMQKSFEAFVQATKLNPSYADAWHNAGNTLVQMGKLDEAIPYFEKSLQFNPNLIEAYNNLALVYHKKGDQKKAYEYLQKSISINNQSAKTYATLGVIEYENGDKQKALEALLAALKLDPTNTNLQQNIAILQNQLGAGTTAP
ncbi:MAG: tetratricopeptide repeat protein [Patescibacteria group bacterium]|nr:tetratricopeptide repeat protein [Patescibacteria group bacterium]